jgi:hypothetical protein
MAVTAVLLNVPATRGATTWMLAEDRPVELATAAFLLLGGGAGLGIARACRRAGERPLVVAFYAAFSVGLLFTAMEEIAWGQWIFFWQTPEVWKVINRQGETTLHNLGPMQGRSELLRVAFGAGGLIGAWIARFPRFGKVSAPRSLVPWFVLIAGHASVDLFLDFDRISWRLEDTFNRTSELLELEVAIAAWLYVRMNGRRLAEARAATPPLLATPEPSPLALGHGGLVALSTQPPGDRLEPTAGWPAVRGERSMDAGRRGAGP